MPSGAGRDASLRHQLAVVRRRWPLVVLLAVLGCATAAGLTSRKAPVYEATASVLLKPQRDLTAASGIAPSAASPTETATEIEVMLSQGVRDSVAAKLGHVPTVAIEPRGATSVIDIHTRSTSPRVAASDATSYAEVYVEQRRSQRVADLLKAVDLIQAQIADLSRQLDELQKPLVAANDKLNATTDPRLRPQLQTLRDGIADSISAESLNLTRRKDDFADLLNQQQVNARLDPSGGVELVSRPQPPKTPISASVARNAALGLVGGLVLGLALAFLFDQLDDRLRRKDELEAAVNLPVLGLLPRIHRRHLKGVVTLDSPSSPASEAYRTLRTSLQFMGIDRPIRCIQVTSATSAEGKTTVVVNLAASFAQAGQRVIVLDCDLRRPKVHEPFGLPNEHGFTSVLLDERTLADAITTLDGEPFLAVLTAGPAPPNPSELLTSNRAKAVLATLRDNCDILLIDSPPVLPVTDALVVSGHVDATLLVARPKRTTRRQIARAQELLDQVGAPLVGTVLNGVLHESGDGYGYGYSGYTPPPRTPREKRPPVPPAPAADETTGTVAADRRTENVLDELRAER